jgi:hypothetical protein
MHACVREVEMRLSVCAMFERTSMPNCANACVRVGHARAGALAEQVRMHIYTRIRICLRMCMCIFLMRENSRHIHMSMCMYEYARVWHVRMHMYVQT